MSNATFEVNNNGSLTASWPVVDGAVGYVITFSNDSFEDTMNVSTNSVNFGIEYKDKTYNAMVYAYIDFLSEALNVSFFFNGELYMCSLVYYI